MLASQRFFTASTYPLNQPFLHTQNPLNNCIRKSNAEKYVAISSKDFFYQTILKQQTILVPKTTLLFI